MLFKCYYIVFIVASLCMFLLSVTCFCQTLTDNFNEKFACPVGAPINKVNKFEHFTVEDGLSQMHVTFILQDSKGFLWIATHDGLNRYDGYDFRIFRHSPSDTSSISCSYIMTVFEDKKGNLWVGTNGGGLNLFVPETETFIRFEADKNKTDWLGNRVINSIVEDSSGYLWLAAGWGGIDIYGGLYRFDPQRKKFKCYFTSDRAKSDFHLTLSQPQEQRFLWVGGVNGLFLFDKKKEQFVYSSPQPTGKLVNAGHTYSIQRDSEDKLWLATAGGLKRFDPETKLYQFFPQCKPDNIVSYAVQYVALDGDTVVWFGTKDAGLGRFNRITNTFFFSSDEPGDAFILIYNQVGAILIDRNRNLWAGGIFNGLNKLNLNEKKIITNPIFINPSKHKLVSDFESFYQESNDIFWFGTLSNGLIQYNRKKNQLFFYKYDPQNINSIPSNGVWEILKDKEGYIWTNLGWAVCRCNTSTSMFEHYRTFTDTTSCYKIRAKDISSLLEDEQRSLYLISAEGIEKFNFVNKRFELLSENGSLYLQITKKFYYRPGYNIYFTFRTVQEDQTRNGSYTLNAIQPPFTTEDVNCALKKYNDSFKALFQITNNRWIVIGNSGSIFVYERESSIIATNIRLPTADLIYACSDKDGFLWIVTNYSGIYRIDLRKNSIKIFDKSDGYPFDAIGYAIMDDISNLWLSITGGLVKFNTETQRFNLFTAKDGLVMNDKRQLYQGLNGEIFLGANSFFPKEIVIKETPPNVVITKMQTSYRIFNTAQCSPKESYRTYRAEPLIIEPDDNYLRIEFAALDFTFPKLNQYAYKLEGFDKQWVNVGTQRFAVYTNLNPGTYTFHVRGSNSEGVWNEQGASINIIVTTPWWKTTFAYILYTIVVIGIVYLAWRMQAKRVRIKHDYEMSNLEAEKLHELDELKSRFFTNISHEFRTPLTLILGHAKQILKQTKNDKIKEETNVIHRSAKKLNRLANQLLDLSRIEAGKMKLKTNRQNLISVIKEIISSFQAFAERKKISLRFNPQQEEIALYLDRDKIDKILSNILSNAIKFTPEGGHINVEVEFKTFPFFPLPKGELKGRGVEISVIDTGIGIPEEQLNKIFDRFYQVDNRLSKEYEGTGIGLSLTKELVELHKGKISVESEEGKGSIFKIIFPLGKDHLLPDEIVEEIFHEEYESGKENKLIPPFEEPILIQNLNNKKNGIELIEKADKPLLLIVEDNSDVRKYIMDILEDDYKITEASNGEEGLRKSFEEIPDLIISDIMMSKLDGIQLCHILKTDSRTSHIPLILLTAKATLKDKIEGLETGADDYMVKPFEADELKARIKNLLDQRKIIHEHFQKNGLFEIEESNINSVDQRFLQKVMEVVNEHISDPCLSVEKLAENLAVSRSLLHKKLVAIIGESPGDLIKRIRLIKAAKLIEYNSGNITEIAFEVGFNDPSYFAACFKKQFNISPSQYHRNHTNR